MADLNKKGSSKKRNIKTERTNASLAYKPPVVNPPGGWLTGFLALLGNLTYLTAQLDSFFFFFLNSTTQLKFTNNTLYMQKTRTYN